ncbi:MAG: transporter [Fimbriimonadaceae bacterium]
MRNLATLATATLLGCTAFAQPATPPPTPLDPERPATTKDATITLTGKVEAGFTYNRKGSKDDYSEFGTQVRLNVNRRTEVRILVPGYSWGTRGSRGSTDGFGDAGISLKTKLQSASGGAPAIALAVGTTIPVGHPRIGEGGFSPSITGSFQWDASTFAYIVNFGYFYKANKGAPYGGTKLSALVQYTTDSDWQIFAELVSNISLNRSRKRNENSVGLGLTFFVGEKFTIDASFTQKLNGPYPNYVLGTGVAFKF